MTVWYIRGGIKIKLEFYNIGEQLTTGVLSHQPRGPVAPLGDGKSLLHLPAISMTEASNIIAALPWAAKSQQEITLLANSAYAYGDKTVSINLIK